jgi:uncharacterized membrane protein
VGPLMASFAPAALGRQRDRRHVELELHRLLELGLQQREHAFPHEVGANARRLLGRAAPRRRAAKRNVRKCERRSGPMPAKADHRHAFVLSEEPILLAKISAFAAHSWPAVRATGTKRPDRSCGRWLGLGDWGMGEIFHFAFMRRRVRHGALTMRLRSHVRSAVKTASWRAFAAVDTFGLVWLFSGHDTTHAIAAAGAVVGVEAITKSFLYFAHERLWEAPLLR